ncbi:MAG: tetratricopeptide repeat protein [Alphaproteobacteria bacterium]
MLKFIFPERLARDGFWWRNLALFILGGCLSHLGATALEAYFGTGLLHQYMIFFGGVVLLALSFAGARANDIRQKGGDDGMAHLGFGLPLAMTFCLLVLDEPPSMLQPKIMGGFTLVPLLSLVWVLTLGISLVAFFYLACVGPKDPREQPVDVVMPRHPFMGVPLVLLSVMCFFYVFTLSVAHYKAPALLAAAEKGNADAQRDAAEMYLEGITVKRDVDASVKWLTRAANGGDAYAQLLLGMRYDHGTDGVAWDDAKAAAWYRKSAAQGFPAAQFALGQQYALGQGVKRDYVQAHKWYSLAAAADPDFDTTPLAEERLIELEKLMTKQQLKQVKRFRPKPPPPPPPSSGDVFTAPIPGEPAPPPPPGSKLQRKAKDG